MSNASNAERFAREFRQEVAAVGAKAFSTLLEESMKVGLGVAVELARVDTGTMKNSIQGSTSPNAEPVVTERGSTLAGTPPTAAQTRSVLDTVKATKRFGKAYLVGAAKHTSYNEDGTDRMSAQPMFAPAAQAARSVTVIAGKTAAVRVVRR